MCGRFAYNKEQITPWAKGILKINLDYGSNYDVRPTDSIAAIISEGNDFTHHKFSWGIKPDWSKKLIINAQSEGISTKKTFKDSFENRRCIVPMSGWYEWKDEGGSRKQKYYFSSFNKTPLLMAGIWFKGDEQVVTLTTSPNDKCSQIHHRMPLIINIDCIDLWLSDGDVSDLLSPIDSDIIQFTKAY